MINLNIAQRINCQRWNIIKRRGRACYTALYQLISFEEISGRAFGCPGESKCSVPAPSRDLSVHRYLYARLQLMDCSMKRPFREQLFANVYNYVQENRYVYTDVHSINIFHNYSNTYYNIISGYILITIIVEGEASWVVIDKFS